MESETKAKKSVFIYLLLVMILILCSYISIACEDYDEITGEITSVEKTIVLIESDYNGLIEVPIIDELYDEQNEKIIITQKNIGDRVIVNYSGPIMETYPAKLKRNGIDSIVIMNH